MRSSQVFFLRAQTIIIFVFVCRKTSFVGMRMERYEHNACRSTKDVHGDELLSPRVKSIEMCKLYGAEKESSSGTVSALKRNL